MKAGSVILATGCMLALPAERTLAAGLDIDAGAGGVQLIWGGPGVLESSPAVGGVWTTLGIVNK